MGSWTWLSLGRVETRWWFGKAYVDVRIEVAREEDGESENDEHSELGMYW